MTLWEEYTEAAVWEFQSFNKKIWVRAGVRRVYEKPVFGKSNQHIDEQKPTYRY